MLFLTVFGFLTLGLILGFFTGLVMANELRKEKQNAVFKITKNNNKAERIL